jgi:hypothetical protein
MDSDGLLQARPRTVENPSVDHSLADEGEVVPEHFLALFYGLLALALGATVWSAMAAVFGLWSLSAAPGLGWLIAWACRYGGRRPDTSVRVTAWLLGLAGVLVALFAFSAFSVTQTSPDSGFQLRAVALEYVRLFAEPPWFGSAAVLLALAGTWRALRGRPLRRAAELHSRPRERAVVRVRPGMTRARAHESDSRAA